LDRLMVVFMNTTTWFVRRVVIAGLIQTPISPDE